MGAPLRATNDDGLNHEAIVANIKIVCAEYPKHKTQRDLFGDALD